MKSHSDPVRVSGILRDMDLPVPRHVIGLDVDTDRIACALVVSGRLVKTWTIPRRDYRGQMRPEYPAALRKLVDWAARHGTYVLAEDCFLKQQGDRAANVRGYRALCTVHAELDLAAFEHGIEIHRVQPTSWMHSVLGIAKGRDAIKAASKATAESWAVECNVPMPANEHEADATCIARFALKSERYGPKVQRTPPKADTGYPSNPKN